MKINRKSLNRIIAEEVERLLENDSYVGKEDINVAPGRKLFENIYLLDVVDQANMEVEMRRDSSQSPAEYTQMKNYAPTAQPRIIRMDEPITDETIMNRKMFSEEFVNKRVKNEYPELYDFFDGLEESQEDTFDISAQETLDISVFITFDAESLSVLADLFITDGSVVKEPVYFKGFLHTIREDRAVENMREEIKNKFSSVVQQYEKFPTILEFPNGDHGEAAEYIDNNTDIKVVWVSDFDPFLILLPVQSENKIVTELRNSGFEYNIEYE